jgi:ABC-type lipoprotein release transport system permease subunit
MRDKEGGISTCNARASRDHRNLEAKRSEKCRREAAIAVLAILITVVGLYGLTADPVVRRARELAIRFALGANERGLVALVLKEAAFLGVAGVALGLLLALAPGQLVSGMLVTSRRAIR